VFRLLQVNGKRLGFDQHHDFAKKFTDHLRDDRCIIRPSVINTNLVVGRSTTMLHGEGIGWPARMHNWNLYCRMLKQFVQQGRRGIETGGVPSGVR
jgi:hypothetical protein